MRALEAISTELGCHSIYAFAHLAADNPTIRYARAAEVAKLAEEWEAEYLLTHQKPPRYHWNIDEFDVAVDRISDLLTTQGDLLAPVRNTCRGQEKHAKTL